MNNNMAAQPTTVTATITSAGQGTCRCEQRAVCIQNAIQSALAVIPDVLLELVGLLVLA